MRLMFACAMWLALAAPAGAQRHPASPPLPTVINGPAVSQFPPPDAATGPTGARCEAVLLALQRALICRLTPPLPLGATCECPFPPPPPGLLPSPPAIGQVVP